MTLYPYSTYFFSLSPHALIMNPSLSLTSHILSPNRLESLMLKDKPVVPPDSVIKTFSHLKGDKVDLVLTQDMEGLCHGSFVIRQGDWAKFFLDSWFDPLYRNYNFQKAERHALVRYPPSKPDAIRQDVRADDKVGTCRAMAPHTPRQNGPSTPAHPKRLPHHSKRRPRKRSL